MSDNIDTVALRNLGSNREVALYLRQASSCHGVEQVSGDLLEAVEQEAISHEV